MAMVNVTCEDTDDIDNESFAKMQEILGDFKTWCNQKRQLRHVKNNNMYVPMSQGSYNGTVRRINNTYHMS